MLDAIMALVKAQGYKLVAVNTVTGTVEVIAHGPQRQVLTVRFSDPTDKTGIAGNLLNLATAAAEAEAAELVAAAAAPLEA